jgi:hypothetical protein
VVATTARSNTTGWAPLNGRRFSAQPSGVAQRSQHELHPAGFLFNSCRDQLHLLTIALRERPDLLARVQPEPIHELIAIRDVSGAVQPGEELKRLGARQRRPQERLAGDISDAPVSGHRIAPGIDAEQRRPAGAGAVQAEQQPDRRCLAGAVGTQVAVHLALVDRQVETIEGERGAIAL